MIASKITIEILSNYAKFIIHINILKYGVENINFTELFKKDIMKKINWRHKKN